jgi:hypothetical protein
MHLYRGHVHHQGKRMASRMQQRTRQLHRRRRCVWLTEWVPPVGGATEWVHQHLGGAGN